MGEERKETLRAGFDRSVKIEFERAPVTSDTLFGVRGRR